MKLVCISDTHNRHNEIILPPGDIIIHAGDATGRGTEDEVIEFLDWFGKLPYEYKIFVPGNHDWLFEKQFNYGKKLVEDNGIIYLNDTGIQIEGINFWASAVQPEFCSWAFNRQISQHDADLYGGGYIGDHWDLIPENVDVLITHGPAYGMLDMCAHGERVGCPVLARELHRVKPKVHIFGHIHEDRGQDHRKYDTYECTFINASSLDARYVPYKRPAETIDIEND